MNKNFSQKTKEEILARDNELCRACGGWNGTIEEVPHHIFYRSELHREFARWPENGATIHKECHHKIHHTPDGKEIDKKLKQEAILMFMDKLGVDDLIELIKIYKSKHYAKK